MAPDDAALEREFNLVRTEWTFPPRYNVAPTQNVPVIRSVDGSWQGTSIRWGLIPHFMKGEPPKFSCINARLETVQSAASYRGPWQRGQRCLQVASGFYEWHVAADGRKAPYYIHLADQQIFAFAGLWERSYKADGSAVESCVHITLPGNDLMKQVHNAGSNPYRMPAILKREDHALWLEGSPQEALAALRPYEASLMVAYEVSPRVNSAKHDAPDNIVPVPAADAGV